MLSGAATSLQFFSETPFPSVKSFQFMNFSEAMFYENYLTSDFHTNTVGVYLFLECFFNSGVQNFTVITHDMCTLSLII